MLKVILALLVALLVLKWLNSSTENFHNIYPTTLIDPEYYNINEDPFDYKKHLRVGGLNDVASFCSDVTMADLLAWIENYHPTMLYECVYKYDPSININNPIHTPRILRGLLTNLPEEHPILRVIKRCTPRYTQIA